MEELFNKVGLFFKTIENSDLIELEEVSSFSELGVSDRILKKYKEKLIVKAGVTFDDNQIKIIGLTSISLKWQNRIVLKNKFDLVYGGFGFSMAKGLFSDQDEWLQENPLEHPKELVDNLYAFNDSEIVGNMFQNGRGCFYREHGKWPLDIYFFDAGVRIKMNLTLEEYIQAMIDSCAVAYWQYFYVDVNELVEQNMKMTLRDGVLKNNPIEDEDLDSPRLSYLINELEVFTRNLPDLFPGKDFSYHTERLALIKEKAKFYL